MKLDAEADDAGEKAAASDTDEKPTTSRCNRCEYVATCSAGGARRAVSAAHFHAPTLALLRDFADFLNASGAAEKHISNKVMSQRRVSQRAVNTF